jgi:DNA replication protein DnaC
VKTQADVVALLGERQKYAKAYNVNPKGNRRLRLQPNQLIGRTGWTRAEYAAAQIPENASEAEKHVAIRTYWLAEWGRRDAKEVSRQRKETWNDWQKYGPPKGKYRAMTVDDFRTDSSERRNALGLVLAFPNTNDDGLDRYRTLALLGGNGTGKTSLAALWLRKQHFEGLGGICWTTSAAIAGEGKDAVWHFGDTEFLVVDEIKAGMSSGGIETLTELFEHRTTNGFITCFTSNMSLKELHTMFGARGYSRLMCRALTLAFSGPDYRLSCGAAVDLANITDTQVVVLTGSDHRLEKP